MRIVSSTTRRVPLRVTALRTARVLMLAGVLLAPAEALAHACDRTDNDRREASRVIRNLTQEIDEMERAIVEALRLQTGQLSGYTAQSAKAIVGALDSQTRLQAQIAREAAETEAMRARRPARGACEGITGLAGLAGTAAASSRARARASVTETGRITGDRAVVERPGAAAGDAARFETLAKTYCNAARSGEDPDLCRGADALHGADLQAGTLFDRRTFASEDELRAAVELSRNLAAPVVHDPPPLSSADTDRERRRALLARAADARTALAADYFADSRAIRAPGAELGAWAVAVAGMPGRDAGGHVPASSGRRWCSLSRVLPSLRSRCPIRPRRSRSSAGCSPTPTARPGRCWLSWAGSERTDPPPWATCCSPSTRACWCSSGSCSSGTLPRAPWIRRGRGASASAPGRSSAS